MNRSLATLAAAAALALAGTAHAQDRSGLGVLAFIGFGVTGGGDTLESFDFSNGTRTKVSTGGTFDARLGFDFPLGGPISLQVSAGYHADAARAADGDYVFSRIPVEVLGHVALNERWRVGLGVRQSLDARVRSGGAVAGYDSRFDPRTGVVAELEYLPFPHMGLKLRAVSEKYEGRSGTYAGRTYDGSHAGAYISYYFR